MNSMPSFIRSLANILIGLFGGLMWAAASFGIILLFTIGHQLWRYQPGIACMSLGALVGTNLIGFSMYLASELINGSRDFKMPARRLPHYVGLRLLEQLLAVLGLSAFCHALALIGPGNGVSCGIGATVALLLYLALEFTNRIKRVRSDHWRKELPDAPLPPDFS